jgi:hypothetical protein
MTDFYDARWLHGKEDEPVAPSVENDAGRMTVQPWFGQRRDAAACLHFGAVDVVSVVTEERLSRWCPTCDGTQYTHVTPPGEKGTSWSTLTE